MEHLEPGFCDFMTDPHCVQNRLLSIMMIIAEKVFITFADGNFPGTFCYSNNESLCQIKALSKLQASSL